MADKVSASQAAKMVGKSIPTITRAIKKGKISAKPNPDGGWLIDPSELTRVWDVTPLASDATPPKLGRVTSNETGLLRVKLDAKEERITDLENQIADLRSERDDWKDQAKTLLIANQNKPEGQGGKRGFLGLFGRSA